MVSLVELTNSMADTLRSIPDLIAMLESQSPNSIVAYVDQSPKLNALASAIYSQKPGTVLVVWEDTSLSAGQGEIIAWLHHISFYLRALSGQNVQALIDQIMNGVPVPGDGLRWRYCPVMDGVLPTEVVKISRDTDAEHIDLIIIETETKETADA